MVTEIELKSISEYDDKKLYEDNAFLDELKKRHPEIWVKVLNELQDVCNYSTPTKGCKVKEYSEKELREIFYVDDFIDSFEDFYFEENPDNEEFIVNYFVKDKVDTDKGVWEMVICNGYEFTN